MINKKIIDTLKSLNIPTYYVECDKQEDKYIIFSIYSEKDTDRFDNINLSETYYVLLNYWYNSPQDIYIYKQIKELMKNNNFKFEKCVDMNDEEFYGKSMSFIFKEFIGTK